MRFEVAGQALLATLYLTPKFFESKALDEIHAYGATRLFAEEERETATIVMQKTRWESCCLICFALRIYALG